VLCKKLKGVVFLKHGHGVDEAEAAEATLVLNMIFLVKNGPQYPEKAPKTSHCLAMLYFLREDGVKVTYFCIHLEIVLQNSSFFAADYS